MEFVFKDLITKCWWSWVALAIALVFAVLTGAGMVNGSLSGLSQGLLAIAAYLFLGVFFARPLINAAYAGHRHLLTVCVWTFVLVVLGILLSFFAFYSFFGSNPTPYDKVLNVVPVFVAIWAAAVGWLVHFRLSSKAHRTNNAFAIIMETRKSSEFLKRQELVAKHFPAGGGPIPQSYKEFFSTRTLSDLMRQRGEGKEVPEASIECAEAIIALKYVLNYFEFMAVGIRAGDLDEDLVYDTISPTVVGLYERSKPLLDYFAEAAPTGGAQPLACTELSRLATSWRIRLNQQIADHANGKC